MPRVLIVDDDAAVRGILYDLLSEKCECHTASSADEAFQCLKLTDYDVVLTDIAMPGASGVELLRRIQLRNVDTPVVFISGTGEEEVTVRLMAMGAFAYVKKPFQLTEVEAVVERAIYQKT